MSKLPTPLTERKIPTFDQNKQITAYKTNGALKRFILNHNNGSYTTNLVWTEWELGQEESSLVPASFYVGRKWWEKNDFLHQKTEKY